MFSSEHCLTRRTLQTGNRILFGSLPEQSKLFTIYGSSKNPCSRCFSNLAGLKKDKPENIAPSTNCFSTFVQINLDQ